MISEEQFDIIKSENELLQLQVEDLNDMLSRRELEITYLKATQDQNKVLQSLLEMNVHEFTNFQELVSAKQQEAFSNASRLENTEEELYSNIKVEAAYTELVKQKHSLEANLADTTNELNEVSSLFVTIKNLTKSLAETKSLLGIALEENRVLQLKFANTKKE